MVPNESPGRVVLRPGLAHEQSGSRPDTQGEQIVAAMTERGIPHRYLVFPDEGHGFRKPENNLAFHAAAEEFLAEHLGGRLEPAHAAEQALVS